MPSKSPIDVFTPRPGVLSPLTSAHADATDQPNLSRRGRAVGAHAVGASGGEGIVRPTAPRVEIHVLLGWKLDRVGAGRRVTPCVCSRKRWLLPEIGNAAGA